MLNILIVDDDKSKIAKINLVLSSLKADIRTDKAMDVEEAKNKLLSEQFDIMILDLFIPTKCGLKDAKPENARDLLNYIKAEDDMFKPFL